MSHTFFIRWGELTDSACLHSRICSNFESYFEGSHFTELKQIKLPVSGTLVLCNTQVKEGHIRFADFSDEYGVDLPLAIFFNMVNEYSL